MQPAALIGRAAAVPVPNRPGKPAYSKDDFLAAYYAFCHATERLYQEVLMIRKLPVDTYQLWAAVREHGGHMQVQHRKLWASTARLFDHPKSWTNASHYFRTTYEAAGLIELENLVDSRKLPINSYATQQQQQQQHEQDLYSQSVPLLAGRDLQHDADMPPADVILPGGASAAAAAAPESHSFPTGPAVPASSHQQQQQPVSMASAASAHDQVLQHSHSIISSATAPAMQLGRRHHPPQQQQQHAKNPAAYMRLAVRCGTAHGLFDIARQRATCLCAVCVQGVGPGGVEMMPTEFERHGGCGSFKKWKKSILVVETGRNIGSWLNHHGLTILNPSALTKKTKKRQLQATIEANRAAGRHVSAAAAAAAGMHSRQLPGAAAVLGGAGSGFGSGAGTAGWQGGSCDFAAAAAAAAHTHNGQQQQQHFPQHRQQHDYQQQQQQHPAWQQGEHLASCWGNGHTHGPEPGAGAARLHLLLDSCMQPAQGLQDVQGCVGRTSSNGSRMTQHSQLSSQCAGAQGGGGYALLPHQRPGTTWEVQGWEQQQHQQPNQQQRQDGDVPELDYAPGYSWQQHTQQQQLQQEQQQQQQRQQQSQPHRSGSGFSAGSLPGAQGSGGCLQHKPAGLGLVGCRVRVWWPLDHEWYSGTIQAVDPQLQLHTLLYDDGDLEQLNLSEEQWELLQQQAAPAEAAAAAGVGQAACEQAAVVWDGAGGQSQKLTWSFPTEVTEQGVSAPGSPADVSAEDNARAAAAYAEAARSDGIGRMVAAAATRGALGNNMDLDSDEQHPSAARQDAEHDHAAWLAAAEAAAADRPLRVMWDSHACVMRVVAAADLVAAESEMRRQEHQRQQQQHLRQCDDADLGIMHDGDCGPDQQQQQQQQQGETVRQQWQHCAGKPTAALLPQLPARPTTWSTSSTEAAAQRQPDELPQELGLREHQQQPYDQQAVQLHEQPLQNDNQQQQLQVCVSRAEEPRGFQVLVALPGCCLDDVRIKAWDDGQLLIRATLHAAPGSACDAATAAPTSTAAASGVQHGVGPDGGFAAVEREAAELQVQVVERLVQLPGRIAASTAGALMMHSGQLYVRVADA